MNMMNAKEFCEATNWDLKTIRRLCREDKLSHWRCGKVYKLDREEAERELKRMKHGDLEAPRRKRGSMAAFNKLRQQLREEWREEE